MKTFFCALMFATAIAAPYSSACELFAERDDRAPFQKHIDGMVERWTEMRRGSGDYFVVIVARPGESAESAIIRYRQMNGFTEHEIRAIRRSPGEPYLTALQTRGKLTIFGEERLKSWDAFKKLLDRVRRIRGVEISLRKSDYLDEFLGSTEIVHEGSAIVVRQGILSYIFYFTDLFHEENPKSNEPLIVLPGRSTTARRS